MKHTSSKTQTEQLSLFNTFVKTPKRKTPITGQIPMVPDLKKYLQRRENIEEDAPLIFPGKSIIKLYLSSIIFEEKGVQRDSLDEISKEHYTVKQKFEIHGTNCEWGDLFYTPSRIVHFNTFVRSCMLEDLTFQTIINFQKGINEKETIYNFLDFYELEQPFDTIKKAVYRLRKDRDLDIFPRRNDNVYLPRKSA